MEVRLARLTWRQVTVDLERSRLVVIPIGSTEQHGPNGLLGTDAMCAEEIATRVGEEVSALVAPTISVGMALHHMAFAGTISLSPATLQAVIADYVSSLHRHGFRAFLFVNGHGGNLASGNAAFSSLRERYPEVILAWMDWWHTAEVETLSDALYGDGKGQHATPAEIAVTMVNHQVEIIDGPLDMDICRPRGIAGSDEFRQTYPDGRIGSDPSLARPEHGERLIAAAVAAIAEEARRLAAAVAPDDSDLRA